MPLYLFSLSLVLLSLSFSTPPPTVYPLHQRNNHPYRSSRQKISLAHRLSPSLTLSLCLSNPPPLPLHWPYIHLMPLYLFSLSLFFIHPHPYIGLISTLCLSIFSLSLLLILSFFPLTYVLMDNFLSLF